MVGSPILACLSQVKGGAVFSRFIKPFARQSRRKNLAEAAISCAGHGLRPGWKAGGRDGTERQKEERTA